MVTSSLPVESWWGTSGEIFTNTDVHGKVLSTAIGIPISYTNQVTNILIDINTKISFPGIFAFRYVKQSKATLAFTQYDPTCVVELDGVESEHTWSFYNAVWDAMQQSGIPHTFHWGKIYKFDDTKVKQAFGVRRDNWVKARNSLLSKQSLDIFSSTTLNNLGLDQIIS